MPAITDLILSAPRWTAAAVATLTTGAAAGTLAQAALEAAFRPTRGAIESAGFERERRAKLRAGSATYRAFEPVVDRLATARRRGRPEPLRRLAGNLVTAGELLPWAPEEYLAARQVEAIGAGLAGAVLASVLLGAAAAGLGLGVAAAWVYLDATTRQVSRRATARIVAVKRRLYHVVELWAVLMEAGSGFQDALAVVVRENRSHPLGEELGRALREIALGRTRREALEAFRERVPCEETLELVFAVNKGEELGTPLAQLLRSLSGRMLIKHSLIIEKAAAEAQVAMVFPAMLSMLACLLVVAAPFVLNLVTGS